MPKFTAFTKDFRETDIEARTAVQAFEQAFGFFPRKGVTDSRGVQVDWTDETDSKVIAGMTDFRRYGVSRSSF